MFRSHQKIRYIEVFRYSDSRYIEVLLYVHYFPTLPDIISQEMNLFDVINAFAVAFCNYFETVPHCIQRMLRESAFYFENLHMRILISTFTCYFSDQIYIAKSPPALYLQLHRCCWFSSFSTFPLIRKVFHDPVFHTLWFSQTQCNFNFSVKRSLPGSHLQRPRFLSRCGLCLRYRLDGSQL